MEGPWGRFGVLAGWGKLGGSLEGFGGLWVEEWGPGGVIGVPGDILASWGYFGGPWLYSLPCTAPPPCPPDQLPCGDGSCLSRTFACDGERDCPDGEDELGCGPTPSPPPCDPFYFRCRDGSCIPLLWRCDGERDCRDGDDEEPELCGTPRPPRACPPLQFPCGSGECVHGRWRCDGTPDCRDSSDEEGCGACTGRDREGLGWTGRGPRSVALRQDPRLSRQLRRGGM